MYTQTVYEAGNSLAITIPKEIVRDLKLKRGHRVTITRTAKNRLVVETAPTKSTPKAATEKAHQEWLKVFMDENSDILDELAKH